MKKLLGVCLASWLTVVTPAMAEVRADQLQLREGYPQEYVVVKGDTLWDISGHFLQEPWRWPQLWDVNPQIDNPHLIYPGDILYLTWVNGQPRLSKSRDDRLMPRARVSKIERAIPAIPLKDIYAFMNENVVLDSEMMEATPYILGGRDKRIIAGAGDRVYARGQLRSNSDAQNIYRPAKEYRDPVTDELLGYELTKVADATVTARNDDVSTLDVDKSRYEIRILDRVLPTPSSRLQSHFYPDAAPAGKNGLIISVPKGVNNIGRFDAVTINLGKREQVKAGDVFKIFTRGETVADPVTNEVVQLPMEEAGSLMVFKAYEKVSYGLVMTATNVLAVGDIIKSPFDK